MPMNGIGATASQMARLGAPFAMSAISVPAPTPISMLPPIMACDILLPPVKSEIFKSSPCLAKMPSLSPTLTGRIGDALASALPTVSVVAADAGDPKSAVPIAMASAMVRMVFLPSLEPLGGFLDEAQIGIVGDGRHGLEDAQLL